MLVRVRAESLHNYLCGSGGTELGHIRFDVEFIGAGILGAYGVTVVAPITRGKVRDAILARYAEIVDQSTADKALQQRFSEWSSTGEFEV